MFSLEETFGGTLEVRNSLFSCVSMEERHEEVPNVDHNLYRYDREHQADSDDHGIVHVLSAPLSVREQIACESYEHHIDP